MLLLLVLTLNDEDGDFFEQLINKYLKFMTKVACRLLTDHTKVEEALQDSFMVIGTCLERFRRMNDAAIESYIYKIVVSKCEDIRNSYKKYDEIENIDDKEYLLDENDLFCSVESRETMNKVMAAINRLPVKYKNILGWVLINGVSTKEIAKMTGLPINTVKTLISRGKKHLKNILTEDLNLE